MAYHLYHTEGLILGRRYFGEANALCYILTPDLGLVAALAQGVRELRSKLRYQLGEPRQVKLTLVRGRGLWRIVGVETIRNDGANFFDLPKRKLWARVSNLTQRLVQGEEKNLQLFFNLRHYFVLLLERPLTPLELHDFELRMVLRLLADLGYVDEQSADSLDRANWQSAALQLINQALTHSQL